MRVLRNAAIARKKPNAEILKKSKAEKNTTKKEKASKKDPNAPKRPASAFFIFMEDFRRTFKAQFPDAKSGPVVGKAGGEKWKSMSDAEKAPFAEKASKRKAEYEKALEVYKRKSGGSATDKMQEESGKSTSEVHDDEAQEEVSS